MKRHVLLWMTRIPVLGRMLLLPWRGALALSIALPPLGRLFIWLLRSRETTNFSYDLSDLSKQHLAAQLADVLGLPVDRIHHYIRELETDEALHDHLRRTRLDGPDRGISDPEPRFGRRLGWYALVRALKPDVVVETGVDKGLGACVLAAALLRNREEGHPGRYYGTDINPEAGYLLRGPYADVGEILYGDSLESLDRFDHPIDLFINDSDHSAEYEAREYVAIREKLSPGAVILGDNAHLTDKLLKFARETGRAFVFFKEEPERHWYRGAGIGIAFRRGPAPADAVHPGTDPDE